MKKIIIYSCALILLAFSYSCVDEYEDANPPRKLDGPWGSLSADAETNDDGEIEVVGGDTVTLTVAIVDAPGVLDSVGFEATRGGEVISHTFNSIKGQTEGSFQLDFKAPLDLDGLTTLNVTVYDNQVDEDGEADPKERSFSQVFVVSYRYRAPKVTINLPEDEWIKGGAYEFTVDIDSAFGGGVDTIIVSTTLGSVEVAEQELTDILGEESGTVTYSYQAPEDETGTETIQVFVRDRTQARSTTATGEKEIAFEFPAPDFDVVFDPEVGTIPGDIPTIAPEDTLAFEVVIDEVVTGIDTLIASVSAGSVAVDIEDLKGKESGSVEGEFIAPEDESLVELEIEIVNADGRSAVVRKKILIVAEQTEEE